MCCARHQANIAAQQSRSLQSDAQEHETELKRLRNRVHTLETERTSAAEQSKVDLEASLQRQRELFETEVAALRAQVPSDTADQQGDGSKSKFNVIEELSRRCEIAELELSRFKRSSEEDRRRAVALVEERFAAEITKMKFSRAKLRRQIEKQEAEIAELSRDVATAERREESAAERLQRQAKQLDSHVNTIQKLQTKLRDGQSGSSSSSTLRYIQLPPRQPAASPMITPLTFDSTDSRNNGAAGGGGGALPQARASNKQEFVPQLASIPSFTNFTGHGASGRVVPRDADSDTDGCLPMTPMDSLPTPGSEHQDAAHPSYLRRQDGSRSPASTVSTSDAHSPILMHGGDQTVQHMSTGSLAGSKQGATRVAPPERQGPPLSGGGHQALPTPGSVDSLQKDSGYVYPQSSASSMTFHFGSGTDTDGEGGSRRPPLGGGRKGSVMSGNQTMITSRSSVTMQPVGGGGGGSGNSVQQSGRIFGSDRTLQTAIDRFDPSTLQGGAVIIEGSAAESLILDRLMQAEADVSRLQSELSFARKKVENEQICRREVNASLQQVSQKLTEEKQAWMEEKLKLESHWRREVAAASENLVTEQSVHESKVRQLQDRLAQLQRVVTDMTTDYESAHADYVQSQREVQRLKQALHVAEQELTDLRPHKEKAESAISKDQFELLTAAKDSEFQSKLRGVESEVAFLKERLAAETQRREALQEELRTANRHVEQMQAASRAAQESSDRVLEALRSESKQAAEELEEEIAKLKEEKIALDGESAYLTNKVKTLEERLKAAEGAREADQGVAEQQSVVIVKLKEAIGNAKAEAAQAKEEAAQTATRYDLSIAALQDQVRRG